MKIILTIIFAYLIGCFSSAYFIGKIFKKLDIRSHGSGNSGATNAIRVMGLKLGLLTFFLDFAKGIIAVLIGYRFMEYDGGLIAAIFVVLGHDFPLFIGFKGGKGVATTIAAFSILNFWAALISVIVGVTVAVITRYVSLGSIIFLSIVPIVSSIIGKPFNLNFLFTSLLLAIIGIYRHKDNVKRLINGNENKLGRW